jgi:hypothetical protein
MTQPQDNARLEATASTARDDAWYFAEFLRDREERCPICLYSLRGLTLPRCPNCGIALKLAVSVMEPFLAAWITLQCTLLLSAGVGIFFAVIWTIRGFYWPGSATSWGICVPFYFVAMIPAAFAMLYWRRRFMRLRRALQWIVATLFMIVNMSALVLLYLLM